MLAFAESRDYSQDLFAKAAEDMGIETLKDLSVLDPEDVFEVYTMDECMHRIPHACRPSLSTLLIVRAFLRSWLTSSRSSTAPLQSRCRPSSPGSEQATDPTRPLAQCHRQLPPQPQLQRNPSLLWL